MTLTTAVTHHAFAVVLWYLGTRYRRSTVMTNTHIIRDVCNAWPRQEALSWLRELGATGPNGHLTLREASTAADVAYGSDDRDSMLAILGLVSESTHQLSPVQRQGLFYRLSPRASAPHYSRLWALVRDCTGERPGGSTVQLCVRNGLDDLLQCRGTWLRLVCTRYIYEDSTRLNLFFTGNQSLYCIKVRTVLLPWRVGRRRWSYILFSLAS
jgi:hypothetical protein